MGKVVPFHFVFEESHMSEYTGVFAILAKAPLWVILFFFFVVNIGIPFVIADKKSGLSFNYSYSGIIGDLCCFLTVFVIGITVIQRGVSLPGWINSAWVQVIWLAICVAAGIYLITATTPWPITAWPDRYHNAVIVPFFAFFLPPLLVAIWNGRNLTEWPAAFLLVAVWAALVVYDFKSDRINQPARLEKQFRIDIESGMLQPGHYRAHIVLEDGRMVPRLTRVMHK